MKFTQNLKYLRVKAGLTQEQFAKNLGCTRSTYKDYEKGRTEPSLALIIKLADLFLVSIDKLLREDIEALDKQFIEYRNLGSIQSKQLRILSTTVDVGGRENVEIVPNKAKAGYLTGYADPEYITELPKMYIPNLPSGTHRGFELEGDSMLPLLHGSIVIAKYVEDVSEFKDGNDYIIVARDGIAFKRIRIRDKSLQLISFNPIYPAYELPFEDVREAWQYYANFDVSPLKHKVSLDSLQRDIDGLHGKVNLLLKK